MGALGVHTTTDLRAGRISNWTSWQVDAAGMHVYLAEITWRDGTSLPTATYLVNEHDRLLRVRQISPDSPASTYQITLDKVATMTMRPRP